MKLVYIILAHTNFEQTFRLFNKLNTQNSTFVFHISKNCEPQFFERVQAVLKDFDNCFFAKRTRVRWGQFDINQAIIYAIDTIIDNQIDFEYAILLSGQCYPIKSNEIITQVLEQNKGKQFLESKPLNELNHIKEWVEKYHFWVGKRHFRYPYQASDSIIRKLSKSFLALFLPGKRRMPRGYIPYKGSFLWMLTKDCLYYLHKQIHSPVGKDLIKFLKHTNNSGEIFFHTILMNSMYKDSVINNDLRFIIWPAGGHPYIFTSDDYKKIESSDCLFIRKVDTRIDSTILDLIDNKILMNREACETFTDF